MAWDLSDFNSYETWHNKGKLSMSERAHQKVKHILSNYQPEPLPAEVDAKIEEILEQAR